MGPGKGEDDAALLRSQGGFIPQWSSAWRLGELFLFADKLAFAQPGKPRFELSLATVTDVAMERRKFILLHKDVVKLTYVLPNQKRSRLAWFITADAGRWFDEIMTLTKAGRAAAATDGARAPDRARGAGASRPPGGADSHRLESAIPEEPFHPIPAGVYSSLCLFTTKPTVPAENRYARRWKRNPRSIPNSPTIQREAFGVR